MIKEVEEEGVKEGKVEDGTWRRAMWRKEVKNGKLEEENWRRDRGLGGGKGQKGKWERKVKGDKWRKLLGKWRRESGGTCC
jgi:hypothetical protein